MNEEEIDLERFKLNKQQRTKSEMILLVIMMLLLVGLVIWGLIISNSYNEIAIQYNSLINACWCVK